MRTLRRTGLLVVLGWLLVAGIVTAAPARAQPNEIGYLSDLTTAGITPNDGNASTLLQWGYMACTDARIGRTINETVSNIYWFPGNSLTWRQAREVAMAAYVFLC